MKDNYNSIILENIDNLGEKISNFKKLGCSDIGYYTVGGTTILQVTWDKSISLDEFNY